MLIQTELRRLGTVKAKNAREWFFKTGPGEYGEGDQFTVTINTNATTVFDIDVTTDPDPIALEKLRNGEIDALVFVGGKPVNLLVQVTNDDNLKIARKGRKLHTVEDKVQCV